MSENLYAERDAIALGHHYVRHVEAMTAEGLHSKADIAAELAHRDAEIERLLAALEVITRYCERMNEVLAQECGVRFVDNAPLEEARSVLAKAKGVES